MGTPKALLLTPKQTAGITSHSLSSDVQKQLAKHDVAC